MTKAKNSNKIVILVTATVVVGLLTWFAVKRNISSPTPKSTVSPTSQPQTFSSKSFKFEVDVPTEYKTEDKISAILFTKPEGIIKISRSGTNYDRLEDYLTNLSERNSFELKNKEVVVINGLNAVKAVLHPLNNNPEESTYFVYKSYFVYSISTSNPQLYSDLDKIAQSFRFNP